MEREASQVQTLGVVEPFITWKMIITPVDSCTDQRNLLHIDNGKTCDKLGSLANSAAYFELSTDAFNSLSQTV